MQFTYRVIGGPELEATLRKISDGVADLSDAMRDVGDYLAGFFAGPVFASRGQVIGHSWEALNPSYAAYKAEFYPGRPPLIREGKLVNSFSFTSGSSWAVVTNTDEKFAWHQLGTRRLPARVMMDLDEQRQTHVQDILTERIERVLRAA